MPIEKQVTPEQALGIIKNICQDKGNVDAITRTKSAIATWFAQHPPSSPNITILRTDAELLTSALDTILDVADCKIRLQ